MITIKSNTHSIILEYTKIRNKINFRIKLDLNVFIENFGQRKRVIYQGISIVFII